MTPIRIAPLVATLALLAAAPVLPAQQPNPEAEAALQACARAVERGNRREASRATQSAEAFFQEWARARPDDPDPLVYQARLISQCRIPGANLIAKGVLSGRAVSLLEAALALDSTHWDGRFTLAMNHFHAPEFLGRGNDAIREFERLLAQQGGATHSPMYAQTYLRLGELYARRNRSADAARVWTEGARLFPGNTALRERAAADSRPPEIAGGIETAAGLPGALPDAPQYSLEALTVSVSGIRMDDARSGVAMRRLDVLTTPGGAADLLNALQTMPGSTGAAEGGDLYVRGGDPAEAPVWVDGARLFYPGRYETLNGAVFGILDPSVLSSAYFSSGGFSARFGNALSGVLEVETEGRPDVATGSVALNSVQAGAGAQLPLGPAAGAWASLRATDATAMLALHGRGADFERAPRALEGIGSLVWEPTPGNHLKLTGLVDGDESVRVVEAYGFAGPFRSRGENRLLSLSGRALNDRATLAVRGNVSAASRTSRFTFGVLDRERTDRSVSGRVDLERQLGAGARARAGVEAAALEVEEVGVVPVAESLAPGSPFRSLDDARGTSHLGGYGEVEVSSGSRGVLVAGARVDRLPGETEWTVDPRIGAAVRMDSWTLRASGGTFHQGRWRTRYVLPDLDAPSGIALRAAHLVLGVEREGEPALKAEVYRKSYGDYAETGDGPGVVEGWARGVDAVVRWRQQPRLNGWVTYSLLEGRLRLEDGAVVPSPVDVTHTLTTVGRFTLPAGWELGSTARFATGRPYTESFGAIHGSRLPTYARLDGRLTRFWSLQGRTLVTYLEGLNVLDRENVAAYSRAEDGARQIVPTFFSDRTLVAGLSFSF